MYLYVLQVRPIRAEQKGKLKTVYRKCRDKKNESLKQLVPTAVIVEDESIQRYQHKHSLQHFETPSTKRKPDKKSHSPNFETVTWDKEAVLRDLQQHPPAPPPISWQKFARDHNIPGSNGGQVVKEFARESNIDTIRLDGRQPNVRQRMRKRRLHGGEISAPAYPTVATVKDSWKRMFENGELSLGVPCAPFTLTQYSIANGQLEKSHIVVTGRKFSLIELRTKFLANQEKYMHLNTDEEIDAMSVEDLQVMMSKWNEDSPDCVDKLRDRFKELQRTRTLALWHDHATLLGLGIVMVTVHVVYDQAVFYTQSECDRQSINLQSTIESPSIHMICVSSSSLEDQAAFLQDRINCLINCLHSLSESIQASNGVLVTDMLRFFVGDHPAKQYERGTQQGGKYKCGGCGVHEVMMDDLAHTLQHSWRSLYDIQHIAIAGKLGRQQGELKPFELLRAQQIREELHARGSVDTDKRKDDLEAMLKGILKGIQRVPTLLLLNPTGELSDLNLEQYSFRL